MSAAYWADKVKW